MSEKLTAVEITFTLCAHFKYAGPLIFKWPHIKSTLQIRSKDLTVQTIPHKHRAYQNGKVSGSINHLTERQFKCLL